MIKNYWTKVIFILLISLDIFILESIIKYIFILNKTPVTEFYLIPNLLKLVFQPNYNIAFGIPLPQYLIIIIVLIILSLLGFWLVKAIFLKRLWQIFSLSLIIFGALSNLLDRLFYGFVIDYLSLIIWPIFNLADFMIVAGVLILMLTEFFNKKDKQKKLWLEI